MIAALRASPLSTDLKRTTWVAVAAVAAASAAFLGSAPRAQANEDVQPVTEDTFIRAEVDARLLRFIEAGGMNRGLVFSAPTPTDQQTVPRMNRDTLYAGIPIDTSEGFTITVPEAPEGRYLSVYMIDNDHFTIDILSEPGTYEFGPQDTRYIAALPRVQVLDASSEADVEIARNLLAQFDVTSGSMVPVSANWDWEQMVAMRPGYEEQLEPFTQYPPTFQDTRASGNVDPEHHRIAVATSWGLFPDYETVYINYKGPEGMAGVENCYTATYTPPENDAFWSISMYNGEGYMFSDDYAVLNAANTRMNADGTFDAFFGSEELCGDVANRVDTTEGWNFLMRVYKPNESVSAGEYTLPDVTAVN
ncbi:MAG: DUF1214 domain-containing protein [Dinoroseobacter sp.]|nr:DUF1214 domain-containing protein [Dinoroseobacter sp.]